MLLVSLLALRMNVTNDNWQELMDYSSKGTVFGFFYSRRCRYCKLFQPAWWNLTDLYENDTSILLANSDCYEHNDACENISRMPTLPTFVAIHNNRTSHILIENRSLDAFVQIVEVIKNWDAKVPCQKWLNHTNIYPYLLVSYPDADDVTACNKLTELQSKLSDFPDRLLLGPSSDTLKIQFVMHKEEFHEYNGELDGKLIEYAQDLMRPSVGSWPISEAKFIKFRRFGIYLYNQSYDLRQVKDFAANQSVNYGFARMNLTDFREDYPELEFEEKDMPAFAIFNREHTAFTLVKGLIFNGALKAQFTEMVDKWETQEPLIQWRAGGLSNEL
jgi:hypothetical protein